MALYPTLLYRVDAVNWVIYSYQLPLVTGKVRDGLILCLDDQWGEIAPLPGRSQETLKEALGQLLTLLRGGKVDIPLLPSVQFGLESALSTQLEPITAPLYALLSGSPDEIFRQAEIAAQQKYTIVKVKIASFSLDVAKEVIATLHKQFRIRIDCNSAFSYNDAIALFSHFDKAIFDYIEDPTFEWDRLSDFTHPFALDETVLHYRQLPLNTYPELYGFILKPTILGGKQGCTPFIEYAQKHHLKIVFSPSFESGLGLYHILRLAKEFNLESAPLGLDTYRHLKEDLLTPCIDFNTPKITIATTPVVNTQMLTEIAHGKCDLSHFR